MDSGTIKNVGDSEADRYGQQEHCNKHDHIKNEFVPPMIALAVTVLIVLGRAE